MKTTNQLFVTGIGTGVGKTICSAILVEHLQADYWKPIQSGDLEQSDSMLVNQLVSCQQVIHPERYCLQLAASPHKSASLEGVTIDLLDFELPQTNNHLIVEGAGGLFVPLSDTVYIHDLIKKLNLAVVVVAKDYLGCINHTLLTLKALQEGRISVAYFIFNGTFDKDTERAITMGINKETKLIHIPDLEIIDRTHIQQIAQQITT